jgi:hypothetical protein
MKRGNISEYSVEQILKQLKRVKDIPGQNNSYQKEIAEYMNNHHFGNLQMKQFANEIYERYHPSIASIVNPAENLSECIRIYNYYNTSEHYDDGYWIKNKKLVSCSELKHTPSMCFVAGSMYEGTNGFIQKRRQGYRMAKEAISISEKTDSDAAVCKIKMIMWEL